MHVHFPHYLKYLHWRSASSLSQKVSTFLLVTRLELACYISAAFLRAHRVTRDQLRAFIGRSLTSSNLMRCTKQYKYTGKGNTAVH